MGFLRHLLRHMAMPSVLVECGVLTAPADASRLSSPAGIARIAGALAEGIRRNLSRGSGAPAAALP